MKFLITAGPTREPIDPVRYISNRSSGKMGYAIAEAALEAGHEVILVSGPVALSAPGGAEVVAIMTSDEMFAAVQGRIAEADVLVMCAAVADFKPAAYEADKVKKSAGLRHLELIPTVDILSSLKIPEEKEMLVAGFAAETDDLALNAQKKLREKGCDVIVGNDVSRMDAGFESDYNEVTLYFRSGDIHPLGRARKSELARVLVKIFLKIKEKS